MNMKCKIRKLVCLAWMLTVTVVAYAQGNVSGWTVNPYEYQYDMTVYAQLKIDDAVITDYSNYEVAAFVGDECRGVAEVNTQSGSTWLYIRVRSKSASGEKITFKMFDKTEGKPKRIAETINFESNGQVGMPSSPTTLTLAKYTPGDVNDDGNINVSDIRAVIYLIANPNATGTYVKEAADANEDGNINVSDVRKILSIIANSN